MKFYRFFPSLPTADFAVFNVKISMLFDPASDAFLGDPEVLRQVGERYAGTSVTGTKSEFQSSRSLRFSFLGALFPDEVPLVR